MLILTAIAQLPVDVVYLHAAFCIVLFVFSKTHIGNIFNTFEDLAKLLKAEELLVTFILKNTHVCGELFIEFRL